MIAIAPGSSRRLVNTSTPSPVMKPAITARDRKLARNANRKIPKRKNNTAHTTAKARAYGRRSGSPGAANPTRVAPTKVAMEASGLVTRWRELASRANPISGTIRVNASNRSVVIPAIFLTAGEDCGSHSRFADLDDHRHHQRQQDGQ